jgi:hypothetical protein
MTGSKQKKFFECFQEMKLEKEEVFMQQHFFIKKVHFSKVLLQQRIINSFLCICTSLLKRMKRKALQPKKEKFQQISGTF